MKNKRWPLLPYPGLRPFDVTAGNDESVIFFGRKKQIYELIDRLGTSHLIAVLGPSGCGKSSLIRAGVIPYLEKGYLYRAGVRWTSVVMEPGGHPVRALATGLHKALVDAASDGRIPDGFTKEMLEQRLNYRPDALVEFFEDQETDDVFGSDRNILILVDQFEEVFRQDMTSEPEAQHFINLMLNVYHDPPQRLYIILTMRTDFIKQSASFPGLPTVLSHTMCLIDKIGEMGLRDAINEPIKIEVLSREDINKPVKFKPYNGEIDENLTSWILGQMSTDGPYDPDLLPLMQHALLWGWQSARQKVESETKGKTVLRLEDYTKFKNLADCLSNNADSVFNKLTKEQQRIAEVMFRLLCDVTPDGTKIRRVTNVKEIADVAGCQNHEEVRAVIKAFASDGAEFIRWKDEGKIIDVSHESFIRKWEKFNTWADREAEKAKKYIGLLGRAQHRQETGLLDRLALGYYSNWGNENKPTKAWADRYQSKRNDDKEPVIPFEEVQTFLRDSETDCQKKEDREKRKSRNTIMLSSCIIFFFLFALLSWWFSEPHRVYSVATDHLNQNQPEKAIYKLNEVLILIKNPPFTVLPKELRKALGLDDNYVAVIHQTKAIAHLTLAMLNKSLEKVTEEKILESYFEVVNRQPENSNAHGVLVSLIILHLQSNTNEATEKSKKIFSIVEEKIKSPEIYTNIGGIYQNRGNYQMARYVYEKGLKQDEKNQEILIALGNIILVMATKMQNDVNQTKKLLNEAEEYFLRAGKLKPEDTSIMEGLSTIYLIQGSKDRAIESLENLVKKDSTNMEACKKLIVEYFNKSQEFIERQNIENALDYLKKVNESSCLSDSDYINLGQFYLDLGKIDLAIKAFNTSIERLRQMERINPEPYFMLANAYAQIESYSEALDNYQKVLDIKKGKDFRALQGQAFCLRMQGKNKEAVKAYQKGKKYEPWMPPAAATLQKKETTVR
jgi:tetratricopeptide (TPR) repeat protein